MEHNGPIYCRFFFSRLGRKVEVRRSTGLTAEKDARKEAWLIYQHETGMASTGPAKQRSTSPKLGAIVDYFTAHRRECSAASEAAVRAYVNALGRAVRLVSGLADWRAQNSSILNDQFVHDWRAAKYRAKGLDINNAAHSDLYYNWSLNSEMQDVRSLFGKAALMAYEDAGMVLPPQLVRFLSVRGLEAEERGFTAIPSEVDLRMQRLARAVIEKRTPAPGDGTPPSVAVAVVYEMARFAGLTQKEIVNLQTKWIAGDCSYIDVQPFQDSTGRNFQTKRNSKNGQVPMSPERVESWIKALRGMPTEAGYFPPGTCHTHREDLCRREANPWIAYFLPDRIKRLHELRKQCGSDVFHKHGLTAAAAFLRDTEATARKYYLPKGHNAASHGVAGL